MIKKLTKKQRKDYIKNPDHCPYCGGGVLTGDSDNEQDGCITRIIECNECGKFWMDIYQVVDIEEDLTQAE